MWLRELVHGASADGSGCKGVYENTYANQTVRYTGNKRGTHAGWVAS